MKKFIAMLMTAAMLTASVFQTVSFAAFSDVNEDHQYKNAITTLSTLSVISGYEDGTFKPDGAITRAEFTKLIVFMLGLQDIKYQAYTFTDVSADHWARDYIQTGYDRKIIAGFDDGEFKAEEQVTYAQALKMIVCTLGYEDFALARVATTDGWADRYIQEANSLGLTKNVSGSDFYGSATRGMVAQMLYNALEIKMNENNGFNWVSTEKTLLNDYLKVKKLKGTLVAVNDDVTGDCTVTLPENYIDILDSNGQEILIDYSTYTDQQTSLSKYLGNTITVYYRQLTSNDERTLVSIDTETTKNSGIEITSDDVTGYVETGTLKYDDGSGGKVKTAKFKPDEITVRYNGKLVDAGTMVDIGDESYTRSEALSKWLTPDTDDSAYGTIKLTDNGDDGTYDMIQIYDYETIVALSAPSTTDYRITDKLVTGNSLILDPQSATYTFTIVKDNTEIPVTSIAANDVILYAQSLDGEQYSVIVSNKSVTGQISSMSSNGDKMTISGTSYNIGSKCAAYILDKNNKELKVGASGTFYLDAFGTAVYGTLQETVASPYAYITNTFREDGKYYITAYAPSTNASEASSYPLKNSVKINGVSTKAESAVSKIQAAAAYTTDESEYADKIYGVGKTPANTQYSQPARVKITNNEVTDIVLLTSDELVSQNEDKEKITKGKELDEYAYNNNSFTVGGKTAFSVNSSTVVIYVPADRDEKNKFAKKVPSSAFSIGERYYLEAYDLNSSKVAGLVILYGADGTLTKVKKDTDYSVIADTVKSEYSSIKDDTVLKLDMFTGASNTIKSWNTYDQTEFADVKPGDVIQFAYDSDNLIQGRVNVLKYDDIVSVLDMEELYNGQIYNWEKEITPSEDNNYQSMLFDYHFKNSDGNDEMYQSSTLGWVPYSRAVVFNVSQVLTDEKKLYVTKNGFDEVDGNLVLDDSDYEEISITSGTKIVRMEPERDEVSRFVADTTTDLSINDLKDAKNYGMDCSKIIAFQSKGTTKLIVICN